MQSGETRYIRDDDDVVYSEKRRAEERKIKGSTAIDDADGIDHACIGRASEHPLTMIDDPLAQFISLSRV